MCRLFTGLNFGALSLAVVALAYVTLRSIAADSDPKVLVVEGRIADVAEHYPIERLRREFLNDDVETKTPWMERGEAIRYRGPRVADILERHGLMDGVSVQFVAYNNFVSEVSLKEIVAYDPILAIERGCDEQDRVVGRCAAGEEYTLLTTDEQGPIFLVWPYDRLPSSYIPARNSIWVWFVVTIRPT